MVGGVPFQKEHVEIARYIGDDIIIFVLGVRGGQTSCAYGGKRADTGLMFPIGFARFRGFRCWSEGLVG